MKDIFILGGPNGAGKTTSAKVLLPEGWFTTRMFGARFAREPMSDLTQREIYSAFDRALKEVQRRYASGELDLSGRYYTDDELRELAKAQNSKDSPGAAA